MKRDLKTSVSYNLISSLVLQQIRVYNFYQQITEQDSFEVHGKPD